MSFKKHILTLLLTFISISVMASPAGGVGASEPHWGKNIMFIYLMALPIILILFGVIWKGGNMGIRMEDEAKEQNNNEK